MKEVAEVLSKLAVELKTTSVYLWSVLIKQAEIYFWATLIQYVVIGVITYFYYHLIKVSAKSWANWPDADCGPQKVFSAIGIIFGGILLVVAFCMAFDSIQDIITAKANPEYWALNRILKVIGK